MPRRYLFGPVSAQFARENLAGPRQRGECLAFNERGDADLRIGGEDSWESVLLRLPEGWQPDFAVLDLPYNTIPPCLWSAPLPLVGLAEDWDFLWHSYRHLLPLCDLVLTDSVGVEALARAGVGHARPANLFGCPGSFPDADPPTVARDIDVLFVGNLSPTVQRGRLPWLGRLARLSDRHRVIVYTGVFGEDYFRLLSRASIVFNRSRHGTCNRRAFEAAAAGALLFQEEGNREVPAYFRDREECVFYNAGNLEELLDYYLDHEDERRTLAAAARVRVRECGFEALWQRHLGLLEEEWAGVQERAHARLQAKAAPGVLARTWQVLSGRADGDPNLVHDLAITLAGEVAEPPPEDSGQVIRVSPSVLYTALGLVVPRAAQEHGKTTGELARSAAGYFRRALECDPANVVAGLNLVEALVGAEQPAEAIEQARRVLAVLDRTSAFDPTVLDTPHFPTAWDVFRVEWERAAWANAGQPAAEVRAKHDLLRWRLYTLLADLTGHLGHRFQAVAARPDLPGTRKDLGLTLLHAGQPAEAIEHLHQALADNPFDRSAAEGLFAALGAVGDTEGQQRLAQDRCLLARAVPQCVPPEPWFESAGRTPASDSSARLASVIILCCNELEYTRLCLESVLRHTRPPYELVLVDNGSTDGTPGFLEEFRARPGPVHVEVIRNETNRGFPAGCNQGLVRARGEYVVFLNNDTIVTPGWLDGLVAWAHHDWPSVGLVGAVSNYAAPPQQVPAGYNDLRELEGFAARRRQEYAGQAVQVDRLTGFCLLVRREVLERIGGFDEQFGLGFFDDDDLCVRAREAGFRLLLALDVFIHHFGSRTFASLGIDCRQQLQENLERFREKWGAARAAGYRLPDGSAISSSPGAEFGARVMGVASPIMTMAGARPTRVSLTMIVKNEEKNLIPCLESVADLVDEIILTDTGSTDRTKELAAEFARRPGVPPVKVFEFPWVDSFAAARNESLRHATGDWILWLDADDRLDEPNRQRLRDLFAGLGEENVAYVMKCLCLPDHETGTTTVVDHLRLFLNHHGMRWCYRVHEQILPAVREHGGEVRWSEVVIHHTGYQDAATRGRKLERDLRLLELEDAENPGDPFTLFNLGSIYNELGRTEEALRFLRRSLERSDPGDSIVRKLYALIVSCHRRREEWAEANSACRTGLIVCPDDLELLFLQGAILNDLGQAAAAVPVLERLLATPPGAYFASVDPTIRGHKGRSLLATIYEKVGRPVDAEAQWQAVVAEQPGFLPAWIRLGELHREAGRWDDLDRVADRLGMDPAWDLEARTLRAKSLLGQRAFTKARQLLEETIAQYTTQLLPRVLLSYVLLQEGLDLVAAERALRDVLVFDPTNEEARRNLAVLLQQVGTRVVELTDRFLPTLIPGSVAQAETETPLTFVVCVSDEQLLRDNLLRSPCLGTGNPHEVLQFRDCRSAADGLNQGLTVAKHGIVVCLHQDVYLPAGWTDHFLLQYRLAEQTLGRIGVLGVYGVSLRGNGSSRAGHVMERGRLLKEEGDLPAVVDTLDELLLVLSKGTSLTFDPQLGFHFYGADICLAARQQGLPAVVVDAPCHHNSVHGGLPAEFFTSASLFAAKWREHLPVATSCAVIERDGTMRLS